MEIITLENDIRVYCITAKSFPDGVREAHEILHGLVTFSTQRKYFGLSFHLGNGSFIYKAAAEELQNEEFSKHGLEKYIIKKGSYLTIVFKDFMKNIPEIGKAFNKLLFDSRIDAKGIGIEWYFSENKCRCMMKTHD